jgi:bifunctional non-homologous end joining protein LigD
LITHPDKILFPQDGITKAELASYYETIAPVMLPHVCGRPITMERYHRGIGEKGFFQKDVVKGFPKWLQRVEVPKKNGTVHHALACDTRSLIWLANQNCITPHVWTSRAPKLYQPDICVFDLDPMENRPDVLRAAALALRDLLHELGLTSWVKTSGSKGFHIVVPLDGKDGFGEVARFAHAVASALVNRDPEHLTLEFNIADRGGRIVIDIARNGYCATFAASL